MTQFIKYLKAFWPIFVLWPIIIWLAILALKGLLRGEFGPNYFLIYFFSMMLVLIFAKNDREKLLFTCIFSSIFLAIHYLWYV